VGTHTITISEIFGPTVQGEGALIGKPTVLVRTGGCDYECPPCDTLYAVLHQYKNQWRPMTSEEVFAEVQHLSADKPILVTLSGGNPAMQHLEALLDMGHAHGYTFCMETQGSIAKPWFNKLDYLTLSPKGPSMIGTRKMHWERLDHCITCAKQGTEQRETQIYLKIVVFDDEDCLRHALSAPRGRTEAPRASCPGRRAGAARAPRGWSARPGPSPRPAR